MRSGFFVFVAKQILLCAMCNCILMDGLLGWPAMFLEHHRALGADAVFGSSSPPIACLTWLSMADFDVCGSCFETSAEGLLGACL
jgi:hypothetical protein